MKKIIFSLVYFLPLLAFGQESLKKDTAFFKMQLSLYSQWLANEGLSGYIEVLDYRLLPQNKVKHAHFSLRLKMVPEDNDSAISIWRGLKGNYLIQKNEAIEEALFNKITYLVQVPEDYCSIQILKPDGAPKYKIYTKNGVLVVYEDVLKSIEPDPIYLSYNRTGKLTQAQFEEKYTKEYVLDKVFQFAQQRYQVKKPNCEGRRPVVNRLRSSENQLRFEVLDLCLEVLTDESENPICSFYQYLGGDCNWKTREWLTCTFTYIPNPANGSFNLALRIDGKVGSGYYDTLPRGAYHEMETDYKSYLEGYADKIMVQLENFLKKQ